jgi:hypothetical protein
MQNSLGSQILAIYVKPEEIDVTGSGDKVWFGTVVKHSIDGRWALSMSVATFRHVCKNLMLHIKRSSSLSLFGGIQNNPQLENRNTNLANLYKRHTSEIDLKTLKLSFLDVFEDGLQVVKRYRQMTQEKINKQIAEEVLSKLPKGITKEIQWVSEKNDRVVFDEGVTKWEAFNTLTEKLTHESTNFRSTLLSYQKIDSIFG